MGKTEPLTVKSAGSCTRICFVETLETVELTLLQVLVNDRTKETVKLADKCKEWRDKVAPVLGR
jgi:hypothetical protein